MTKTQFTNLNNEPKSTHIKYTILYLFSLLILPFVVSLLPLGDLTILLASTTLFVSLFGGIYLYRHTLMNDLKALKGHWLKVFGAILLAFVLRIILTQIAILIFGVRESANQESIEQLASKIPMVVYAALLVIAAPVAEELFFREVILHNAKTPAKKWGLGLLSVLLFAGVHVIADPPTIVLFIPLALPIVLIYFYFERNVVVSILTHLFFNFIAFLMILVQMSNPEAFEQLQKQAEGFITFWMS
ncbi:CPBP family intramembrane glutamic endopeptidase [Atopobacter phocae]|uniref:CPBP family intramembrane glutamic endopeptidase n=1 Tax=Atopobacter phocae TaxID=136492 RepID=UPI0004719285|nr:type II CAAX endopeptidase family protein [Atopobacter phocae]